MQKPAGLQNTAPHYQAGASPAASFQTTYGQAKEFLSSNAPAAQRFQSNIIGPQQQEIDALRAQVMRLSGVLIPSDPRHYAIVREASARFAKSGGPAMLKRRRAKLKGMTGDLKALEDRVGVSIQEMAELRLNCTLYASQVEQDQRRYGDIEQEEAEKVARWEAEAVRLEQARVDRRRREDEQTARRN